MIGRRLPSGLPSRMPSIPAVRLPVSCPDVVEADDVLADRDDFVQIGNTADVVKLTPGARFDTPNRAEHDPPMAYKDDWIAAEVRAALARSFGLVIPHPLGADDLR